MAIPVLVRGYLKERGSKMDRLTGIKICDENLAQIQKMIDLGQYGKKDYHIQYNSDICQRIYILSWLLEERDGLPKKEWEGLWFSIHPYTYKNDASAFDVVYHDGAWYLTSVYRCHQHEAHFIHHGRWLKSQLAYVRNVVKSYTDDVYARSNRGYSGGSK